MNIILAAKYLQTFQKVKPRYKNFIYVPWVATYLFVYSFATILMLFIMFTISGPLEVNLLLHLVGIISQLLQLVTNRKHMYYYCTHSLSDCLPINLLRNVQFQDIDDIIVI